MSAETVAAELQLDARMTELFLNACTGLGLCEKSERGYANSTSSQVFLTSNSPASMRNSMSFMDDIM